jgi:hypothetical protein
MIIMNHDFTAFSPVLLGILIVAIWSNSYVVYAQQSSSSLTPSPQSAAAKVKIASPTKGQQVSVGKDLTISGTSTDNATPSSSDCKVSVIVNKVRPYQPATPVGPGGAADYSKWNFALTSKYTTIKPGENRITAKYECANNAALTSFSSVNVTGVPSATTNPANSTTTGASTITNLATTATTKPNATTIAQEHTTTTGGATTQQQQHLVTTNTNNLASASNNAAVQGISPTSGVASKPLSITSPIAPQIKTLNQQPHQQMQQVVTVSNKTDVQNSKLASPSPVIASDKLMYLGYHDHDIAHNNDSPDKNTMGTKSVSTRGSSTSTSPNNDTSDKGSAVIKYGRHDIAHNNDSPDKNTMGTKSVSTRGSSTSTFTDNGLTFQHKDRDISTSQVNVNRNTDNVNNNFIFPFSYP